MIKHILLFVCFLGIAIAIPFFYVELLYTIVSWGILGWVTTSILIRLVVMLLFILALKQLFLAIKKTRNIKNWIVVAIGAVPGFFLSFAISPIYALDYGMLNDGMEIAAYEALETETDNMYERRDEPQVLAFFEVGCYFCQIACQKLATNLKHGQSVPVHVFFMDEQEDIDRFITRNGGEALNVHRLADDETFITYSGFSFPSIYSVNADGETEFHWVGDEMNYSALDYLLSLEH